MIAVGQFQQDGAHHFVAQTGAVARLAQQQVEFDLQAQTGLREGQPDRRPGVRQAGLGRAQVHHDGQLPVVVQPERAQQLAFRVVAQRADGVAHGAVARVHDELPRPAEAMGQDVERAALQSAAAGAGQCQRQHRCPPPSTRREP